MGSGGGVGEAGDPRDLPCGIECVCVVCIRDSGAGAMVGIEVGAGRPVTYPYTPLGLALSMPVLDRANALNLVDASESVFLSP